MGLGFRADPNLHRAGIGPFRVRIEARQRWVAPARVSGQTWLDAINYVLCPWTENTMTGESPETVKRACCPRDSRKAKSSPLRNEAQLNCVSLRSEFDYEVTWETVKGQDERPCGTPLTGPYTNPTAPAQQRPAHVLELLRLLLTHRRQACALGAPHRTKNRWRSKFRICLGRLSSSPFTNSLAVPKAYA
jgi:hypothetical protein